MSRPRKATAKPPAIEAEAIYWRATVLTEILSGLEILPQCMEPVKRLKEALADFDASRGASQGVLQL